MIARSTVTVPARLIGACLSVTQTVATVTAGTLSAYLGVVTLAAMASERRRSVRPAVAPYSTRRFAVLVPAHNEQVGIGKTLLSFDRLAYPRDMFEVHVVADNCSDETARIVRDAGWTAHERFDIEAPGKGPALNWLYECLHARGVVFDTVVIVDADTTLDPQFLRALAVSMDSGAQAAQGLYGVRDADGSTAAALRYAALACRHHLRPLGRTALGGSSGLYGNGMAFDDALMRDRRWSGHLTEDMEFQMELLLDGVRVAYVPAAKLEAEMPGTLDNATSQNERWELGRLQMARRYVPELIKKAKRGDRSLRPAYVDSAFDHAVPPLSVLVAFDGLCAVSAAVAAALRGRRIDRTNALASAASFVIVAGHVVVALHSINAPKSVYRALLKAPSMVFWKLKLWVRVLVRPDAVTWTRTTRNAEAT